jgi:hypothetical protein
MSTLMVGTQQGCRNNRKSILNPSLSSLIIRGSRPLLTVSTADRSVLHSAEVAHFHHSSRKSSEELRTQPRMCWSAQYHTSEVWLHRDAMKPLQRYAQAPTTHDSYSSGRTITLPSGQHLSKGCYPKRTGLYPCNPNPLCSFRIRSPVQSHT